MHIEEIVIAGKAHREIVRTAHEWCADLIVLGIHGRTAVDRVLFGSTVEPVVRHAACPVLTVRTEAHAATAAA
jgi:nucleotide-binding universal stress UspA family protein